LAIAVFVSRFEARVYLDENRVSALFIRIDAAFARTPYGRTAREHAAAAR